MSFKLQIVKELQKNDWEIVTVDGNLDWWDDEHWVLKSTKWNYGGNIYIIFILDPMEDNSIYEVKATTKLPVSWNDDGNLIASISMSKRKFNLKLNEFVQKLNQFRKTSVRS